MKNMKRLLAVLLAVVMCLSCLTGLSFADEKELPVSRETGKLQREENTQPAEGVGFKSQDFQLRNSYKYADDEIVTAIVLLKGAAPAELPEAQRAAAASRVASQHNTLRNALREAKINYTVEFEYDSLLNGMSITVAYGDLDKIAAIDNVKAVYIANEYAAPVLEPATRMASSNVMTGADNFQLSGYKGESMLVAVLDTGITPKHEAFQVYGDKLGEVALKEDDAKAFITEKGYGTYLSDKIPFSFDYYDQDNDATDDASGHGTHVSGIAAGYAETEEGEITFCGTAPFAQIVAMKIFSSDASKRGTNSGIYFAALEDCYELGVDVINMSIGAQNGFTYDYELEDEVFGNIYQTLEDNGIICSVAAGNEYNMAQYSSGWAGAGYVTSDYADYGVVGSPSTYDGNLSVASLENAEFPGYVLEASDGEKFAYYDSDGTQFFEAVSGKELEYVVIDGYGAPEDFLGVDVEGKIALIGRGDITFQEKVQNAAKAGAAAALIYNNQPGIIYMSISTYYCPAASITQEAGEYLKSLAKMPEVEPEEPDPNPDDTGAVAPTTRETMARAGSEVKDAPRLNVREAVKPVMRDHADAESLIYGCYFESAEEVSDWSVLDADKDGFNWGLAQSSSAYEGSVVLYSLSYDNDSYSALTPDNWAITPAISLEGIEQSTLSLWAKGADPSYAAEVFAIYAGETADPEAMTKLTDDITVTGEWKNYAVDLTDYAGKTVYLAIRHYNVTDQFALFVDQLEVVKGEYVPPEPEPDPNDIGGEVVKGFYFEEEPTEWTFVDADGDGNNWIWSEGSSQINVYEGASCIYSQSYINNVGAMTPDNWAISPAIDLSEVDDGVLSLYARGQDASYAAEVFALYAGTEANPETMTKVSDDITATGEYTRYLADLSAFAGQTIYVAIRHYNVTDMFYLNVDQVEVLTGTTYEPPAPPEPVARPVGTVSFPAEAVILENPDGWQMSAFSSWGATPSLTLKPHITGVGGDVYSASFLTEDKYEIMSGTSMATPNMTGAMAIISEYLNKQIGLVEEEEPEEEPERDGDAENPFTDVAEGDYFYEPVLWAVNHDPVITTGTDADKFSPNQKCTRGQIATFLWRAYGEQEPTSTENPFNDVKENDYFFKAVLWAVEKGITTGTDPGKFSPSAKCTRGQAVTFMWRAAGEPEPTTTENPFDDVKEGDYFYKAVLWAVENEITNGTDPGKFSPNAKCTRGQIVTFLYRAMANSEAIGPLTKPERAAMAEALAESTAKIILDADDNYYSPRKQGAGLVDLNNLAAAEAYITEPIQNLFDNTDGEFEFTLTVKDLFGNGGTYTVEPVVLIDAPAQADLDKNGEPETYNMLNSLELVAGEDYEVEAPETVKVHANGETELTVKITLTDALKADLDALFPNGTYIEGYVKLTAQTEEVEKRDGEDETPEPTDPEPTPVMLHATFMGFYGDWTKAPILEQYDWRDIVDAYNFVTNTVVDAEGNTYADYGYTYLDAVDFQVTTDVSLCYAINSEYYQQGRLYGGYAGDNLYGYDPELEYNDAHLAIAPGTGITDMLYMAPYQLRNARHLIMVATNAETGEVYYVDDTEYLPKAYYDTDNGYWSNTGSFIYDGTDAEGNVLPDGTKVNLTYYANLPYGEDALGAIIGEEGAYDKLLAEAQDFVVWEIPVTIDLKAPEFVGDAVVDKEAGTVTITAKDDNYVAAIFMLDEKGNSIDSVAFGEDEAGAEVTATFEYPEGTALVKFVATDYATNESNAVQGFIEEPTWITVYFEHPEGTELEGVEEEFVAYVGQEFPAADVIGKTDKGEFIGMWTDNDFGDMDSDTLILYYLYGLLDLYGEGDTFTEDMDGMTLYPIYEVEEIVEGVPREDEPTYGWYFEEDPAEEGWTFVDKDGDGFNWEWTTEDGYNVLEGAGILTSASWDSDAGALEPDNWAISPAIDLTEMTAASLSLFAVGQDDDYADENFAVYVGETANPEEMTKLGDDVTAEGSYKNYIYDLTAYAGKTVYVAIRHYNITDMYMLNIDKVEVYDKVVAEEIPGSESYYYTTQPNNPVIPEPGTDSYALATVLKDGDKVVIYNPDSGKAISNADSDVESYPERYRLGVDVEVSVDDTTNEKLINNPDAQIVWTVEITEDGVAFKDAYGKYLSVPANYANLVLDSDCKYWTVTESDGLNFIVSTESAGTSGDLRGIEYYQGKFTTYYASETNLEKNRAAFGMELYVLIEG